MLGYAHYRSGGYKEAIDQFNLVANEDDSLGQVATYHGRRLPEAEREELRAQRLQAAYAMSIDPKVTETRFNLRCFSYEPFRPYHEAIMALRNYLKEYPDSAQARRGLRVPAERVPEDAQPMRTRWRP